jgi:hypothetical protein
LIDAGAATSIAHSSEHSDARERAALGITATGRVIIARGNLASDAPLADALLHAGAVRAVMLDRGAHVPVTFDRAGTSSPPRAHYDDSVLYAIAKPMAPRAIKFMADSTVAQAK